MTTKIARCVPLLTNLRGFTERMMILLACLVLVLSMSLALLPARVFAANEASETTVQEIVAAQSAVISFVDDIATTTLLGCLADDSISEIKTYSDIEIFDAWRQDSPGVDAASAFASLATVNIADLERMHHIAMQEACDGKYNIDTASIWLGQSPNC